MSKTNYSIRTIPNSPTAIIHGIRCVALPALPDDQPHLVEGSFWSRVKWNHAPQKIQISNPILIGQDDDNDKINLIPHPPPPVSKDEKFRHGSAHRVCLDVTTSAAGFTIRDFSSGLKVSRSGITKLDNGPESPVSPSGKTMYPGFKGIPEDLPVHERYVPLSRSRSTHVLEAQRRDSPRTGHEADLEDDVQPDEGWSDTSSVYSQESTEGIVPLVIEPLPR